MRIRVATAGLVLMSAVSVGALTPGGLISHQSNGAAGTATWIETTMTVEAAPPDNSSLYWAQQFYPASQTDHGGYFGIQTGGNINGNYVGKLVLFSLWNATAAEAGPGATAQAFGGEGVGYSVRMAIDWQEGVPYTFRIEKDATDGLWWKGFLKVPNMADIYLGRIKITEDVGLNSVFVAFTEYYTDISSCSAIPYARVYFSNILHGGASVSSGTPSAYGPCIAEARGRVRGAGTGTIHEIGTQPPGADFDGDGEADIAWRNTSTGENGIWLLEGATVKSGASLPTIADSNMMIVATGDVDGDDKSDIVWRHATNGTNAVWLMNGTSISSGALLPAITDNGLKIVGAGDFDGDGDDDLLWRKASDGTNAIWFMNGGSVSSGALLPSVTGTMAVAGVGDFNGDGKADILWRDPNTGNNAVWLMNGGTIAGSAFLPNVAGLNMTIAAVGDFSGDDKSDVFWRNTNTGQNAMWLMNGLTIASGVYLPDAATTFAVSNVGDFDGDGKADVAFRNGSDGTNAIWFMQAAGLKSGALLPAVTDLNLQMVGGD